MSDDDTSRVIQALAHERRRQIISMLGAEGPKGVTELKRRLGMSTGSLYHNLSFLAGIVERTEERKYKLTRRGEEIYVMLSERTLSPVVIERRGLQRLEPLLFPQWIFAVMTELEPYSFSVNLLLMATFFFASYSTKIALVLMLPTRVSSPLLALATSAVSYSIIASTPVLVFGLKNPVRQFLSPSLALVPLIAYQIICLLIVGTEPSLMSETMGLIFVGYSAAMLGASVRSSSNARTVYCLLFAFVLVYLGSVLSSVLSGPLT